MIAYIAKFGKIKFIFISVKTNKLQNIMKQRKIFYKHTLFIQNWLFYYTIFVLRIITTQMAFYQNYWLPHGCIAKYAKFTLPSNIKSALSLNGRTYLSPALIR